MGIVWGAPHSTKPCVGSPTPVPHNVHIIFSSPRNPNAIPTHSDVYLQSPRILILIHPHTFYHIHARNKLPLQPSRPHAIPTQISPSSSPHAKWSWGGPSPRKFRTSRGSVRQGCQRGCRFVLLWPLTFLNNISFTFLITMSIYFGISQC